MKLLRLKCRRRKIILVCAAVLAVELIGIGAFLHSSKARAREVLFHVVLHSVCSVRFGWMQ